MYYYVSKYQWEPSMQKSHVDSISFGTTKALSCISSTHKSKCRYNLIVLHEKNVLNHKCNPGQTRIMWVKCMWCKLSSAWLHCSGFTCRKTTSILSLKKKKERGRSETMRQGQLLASGTALKAELFLTYHPLGENLTLANMKRVHFRGSHSTN